MVFNFTKFRVVFFFGQFLLSTFTYAQPGEALEISDQIESAIEKAKQKSIEADTSAAIDHFETALNLANETSTSYDDVCVLIETGNFRYKLGQFSKAYLIYKEALELAQRSNFSKQEALALKGIAHIEWRIGDNVKSITNILQSIQILTSQNDTTEIIAASDVLASIYISMQRLSEAEEIYDRMLELSIASNDSLNQARIYGHIGVVYFFKEDYEEAINFYDKSLKINEALQRQIEEGVNYGNIAEAYDYLGKHDLAKTYYFESLELLQKHHFNSGLVFVYYGLGRCYTNLGELEEGVRSYEKSLEILGQIGEKREAPIVYELMAENYMKQGDFEKAYEYYKKRSQAKDSIETIQKNKLIEEVRVRYEIDKKEKLNEQLARDNEEKLKDIENKNRTIFFQFLVVALLLLLIVFLVFFYYKIRKQKAQLKEANQTKDKLLSILGHDLRGPVGNLKSITELIMHDNSLTNNPELKSLIASVKGTIHNTFFLLNDLLAWSNVQREGLNLKPEKLDVKKAADNAIQLLKFNASNKNLTLSNHVEEGIYVVADKSALQTILRNLISNAIKFTPEGGKIEVAADNNRSAGQCTISVKDTGIGISEEVVEQLFGMKEFYSTKGTDQEKGTGIGLSICKEFVERSGGRISVESSPGKGSIFYFSLPAY